jgi:hypothetical protein
MINNPVKTPGPVKATTSVPAIAQSASLAARALARLESEASIVHASETERRERSLQMVSTKDAFSAVIRHGSTLIEISDEDFAITKTR